MPEIEHEIGKDRILGGLLKTGQTTQYGGYADDGHYEKGLSKRYTILTAGQYAGATDITLNSKTDVHSNNCVYDQRTKLMWSRYAAYGLGPDSDGKLPWTTNANGEGIFPFAAAANAALLGGYSDWRIPNRYELESLLGCEAPNAKPDATAFPGWPITDYFWLSTTRPDITSHAMATNFTHSVTSQAIKTINYLVALVRGG